MTSAEFWDSWATAQFGTVAGKGAASLFSRYIGGSSVHGLLFNFLMMCFLSFHLDAVHIRPRLIFAAMVCLRIESYNLPRPVNWLGGPGGWQSDSKQCGLVRVCAGCGFPGGAGPRRAHARSAILQDNTTYAFVAEFENLLAAATDPGDNDRLLYWVGRCQEGRGTGRAEGSRTAIFCLFCPLTLVV